MGEIQGNHGVELKSAGTIDFETNYDNSIDPFASNISISIDDIKKDWKKDSVMLGAIISGCGSHYTSMSIPISTYDSTDSFIQGVNSLLLEEKCNAVEFEYVKLQKPPPPNGCAIHGGELSGWGCWEERKPSHMSWSSWYNM